jgi:AcrR family transcriptional regulator
MTQTPTARGAVRAGDGKITRELVLATALEIIDRDGVDGLSMRRLGAALDRDPMILYRHAPFMCPRTATRGPAARQGDT